MTPANVVRIVRIERGAHIKTSKAKTAARANPDNRQLLSRIDERVAMLSEAIENLSRAEYQNAVKLNQVLDRLDADLGIAPMHMGEPVTAGQLPDHFGMCMCGHSEFFHARDDSACLKGVNTGLQCGCAQYISEATVSA